MLAALTNHLWQSTIFAGLAGFLTLVLRRNSARVRYGLWLAASMKFLVPLSLFVAIGGQVHLRSAPAIPAYVPAVFEQIAEPVSAPTRSTPVAPENGINPPPILLFAWACGVAVIAIRWSREWLRVRSAIRLATPLPLPIPVRTMSSPALLEPGVFGAFRPILLLPEGIVDRLTPAELRAILIHELCHVRRRDNLFAAIHMLTEAIFWFHPLLWWIGHRLVDERERACDEEVLRQGSEPEAYAEGILKVCELYLKSPLACVAGVSGADLKKRIQAIMQNRIAQKLTGGKKLLLAAAALMAIAGPVALGILNAPAIRAQSATTPTPKWEVISIRPGCGEGGQGKGGGTPGRKAGGPTPGRLTVACATVMTLIQEAYEQFANARLNAFARDPIEGGPAWINSDRFQINAKAEGTPRVEMINGPMLQALLESRFKLKIHRETREISVYALTLAKGGPKLQPSKEGSCIPVDLTKPPGPLAPGQKLPILCGMSLNGPKGSNWTSDFHHVTMTEFAQQLPVDRRVIDKTGIGGAFDFHLEYAIDEITHPDLPPAVALPDEPSGGPSIFTALQEQLGLKLEPAKGPGGFLVIDSVERPSEN